MGLNTKCPKHGNLHPDFLCPDKKEATKKFVFRDQLTGIKYIVPLLDGPIMDADELLESGFFDEKILPQIDSRELETKYGVHDFSTESDDELFGFTSYEIDDPEKWTELMFIWREILDSLGYKIGDTVQE